VLITIFSGHLDDAPDVCIQRFEVRNERWASQDTGEVYGATGGLEVSRFGVWL
jgi:hypothetical protein